MTIALPQLAPPPRAKRAPTLKLPRQFAAPPDWRARLADLKDRHGFASILTPPDANAKLARGGAAAALTLAPADRSGLEVCPGRSEACTAACVLWFAGNGHRESVRDARTARTLALAEDPQAFMAGIVDEAHRLYRGADRIRALRLNCASDLPWEIVRGLLPALPPVALYDYAKIEGRIGGGGFANGAERPYRLCYSVSDRAGSVDAAAGVLQRGGTVALVVAGLRRRRTDGTYRYARIPDRVRIAGRWHPATPGDRTDRRDRDPGGAVVILAGKGGLELPDSGGDRIGERFAVRVDSPDLDYGRRGLAAAFRR
jgi:hypothetical protein